MKKIFLSRATSLVLLLLYAIGLALATWVESAQGALVARQYIYNNCIFYLLQVLLVVQFIVQTIYTKPWRQKKYGFLFIHFSFIIILTGAMITHLFGYEGIIHLREGESTSTMMIRSADPDIPVQTKELPFMVTLNDFLLQRYPGSHSPSSYESYLTLTANGVNTSEHVYMNKILYKRGFRIYQTSYDPDEKGSVLTVNSDRVGTLVTYCGYFLLLMGFLIVLLGNNSYFAQLRKSLKTVRLLAVFSLLSVSYFSLSAQPVINKELADSFGRLQVQCPTGRIEPVDTYSSKILRKIYKSDTYQGLSSNQVLLGILANSSSWMNAPIIAQSNPDIHALLGTQGKEISFVDLFAADGTYKIASLVEKIYNKPANTRSRMEKDLLKLDERINIFYSLQQGSLLALFPNPNDSTHHWLSAGDNLASLQGKDSLFVAKIMDWFCEEINMSQKTGKWTEAINVLSMIDTYQIKRNNTLLLTDNQIKWELFYNKAKIFTYSAFSYMTFGILLLVVSLFLLGKKSKFLKWSVRLSTMLIVLTFLAQTGGIALRWYISGQAPWSNAYESMIYVAWASLAAGLLFARRSPLTLSLAAFLGGVVLFVAHLNGMDPEITPLVPVLKSYWLMVHVAVITASYGFFGMSFLIGTLSLSFMAFGRKNNDIITTIKELRIVNELSLNIGLALLTIGTFLGAIWANESWGRYWGWDPKETWALITIIVYAIITHARLIPQLRSDYTLSLLSIVGLTAVLMTYFGVNFYLNGLHSYGNTGTPPALWGVLVLYVVVAVIAAVAYFRSKKKEIV